MSAAPVQERAGRQAPVRAAAAGWLGPLAVAVVGVALWQLAALVVPERALPTPAATVGAFIGGLRAGWLGHSLWVTFQVVLVAFGLGAALGMAAGAWLGLQRFWGDVLGAPLVWMSALPKITIFPVFLLLFGLGDASRVAFGAFHGFFPLALIVLAGIRAVPVVYLRAARALNLGPWTTLTRVVVPATLPSVLSGLRFCFSLSFIGVVLAEMFGSQEGAGYQLIHLITLQRLPELFALALSLMAVAFAVNVAMLSVERRFARRGRRTATSTKGAFA